MNFSFRSLFIAAALCSVSAPSFGQSNQKTLPEIDIYTKQYISKNPDRFLKTVVNVLFKINKSGTVTQAEFDAYSKVNLAKTRNMQVQKFLATDLDGNGLIDAKELALVAKFSESRTGSRNQLLFLEADKNQDQVVNYVELMDYANRQLEKKKSKRASRRSAMRGNNINVMLFDENADGVVNAVEISSVIATIAATPIDPAQLRRPKRRAKKLNIGKPCKFPAVPKNAAVVYLSGYEGSAISTVALSGMNVETQVARLKIEPGDTPLYIIASSYNSLVWQVTGATKRIVKFLAEASHKSRGVGVEGLEKKQVTVLDSTNCIPRVSSAGNAKAIIAKAKLERDLKTEVSHSNIGYTIREMSVPSGSMLAKRDKSAFKLSDFMKIHSKSDLKSVSLKRYHPDGVIDVDHSSVFTNGKAEKYDVLPAEAGLLQLMASGAVQRTKDKYYVIKRKIPRYPAGLSGAHSVKFLVDKGVDIPKGSPGHSSVYLAETGECISVSGICKR